MSLGKSKAYKGKSPKQRFACARNMARGRLIGVRSNIMNLITSEPLLRSEIMYLSNICKSIEYMTVKKHWDDQTDKLKKENGV